MKLGMIRKTVSLRYPLLSLLEACSSSQDLKKIHGRAIISALCQFAYITSRILARYAGTGDVNSAHKLFDSIASPTVFNWNTMIKGLSKSSKAEEGLLVYIEMRRSAVNPNMHTFPFAVKACSKIHSLFQIHAQILSFGFHLDVYASSSLISNYCSLGEMELARKVFDECSTRNIVCWTSLISGYCSGALLDRARQVFDEMPEKSDVSWSAMISGYVHNERYEEALKLFLELKAFASQTLNRSLLVSVLSACSNLGAFEEGRWIHSYADDQGFERGTELGTALLNFYAKCGFVELAVKVFDEMQCRDVVAWSAMIGGLAMNGHSRTAIQFFSQMIRSKHRPNAVTFIGLLTACIHGGLVDEGMTFFRDMAAIYGISPSIEHYGCIVDLLSRAGRTEEAERIIFSMPIEPDGAIWGSLLHGCFVNGGTEFAERVGSRIIEVDPDHCGRYVGLANAYAAMGRWEGVVEIRRAMTERGVVTSSGWSLIDVNGSAHRFLANNSSHPMIHEIYGLLRDLTLDMVLNW